MRFLTVATLCFVAACSFAQRATFFPDQAPRKGLEIAIPEGANVSLEVDARDDDLLVVLRKVIAQFDNFGLNSIPGVPKGAFGTFTAADLSALIRNVHAI